MRFCRRLLVAVFVPGLSALASGAQTHTLDAPSIVKALAERCQHAKSYLWEGDVVVQIQIGDHPIVKFAAAEVRIASAEWGKRYLSVRGEEMEPYVVVCDGDKHWSYLPSKKQYREEDGGDLVVSEWGSLADLDMRDKGALIGVISRGLISALAALPNRPQAMDLSGPNEVRYNKKKVKWPAVRLLSPRDRTGARSMTEVTLDPATMTVALIEFRGVSYNNSQKTLFRIMTSLNRFELDNVPDSTFAFAPPEKARRVDNLALPGETTSVLLNKPAPEFELPTLAGDSVNLAGFKGKPVLLSFWATWCGPCRRELPVLNSLYSKYKDDGLVVVGVNDEDKGVARKHLEKEGIGFPTLHDRKHAVHRMFRVGSIPTVVLVDKDGIVAQVFRGSHGEDEFAAALKMVGVQPR